MIVMEVQPGVGTIEEEKGSDRRGLKKKGKKNRNGEEAEEGEDIIVQRVCEVVGIDGKA